jgi:hypothetical protein
MAKNIYVVDCDFGETLFSLGTHKNPYNEAKQFAEANAPSRMTKIEGNKELPVIEYWTCTDVDGITTTIEA